MATKAIKRVLVLHGYSQNATVLSKRLGALRKEGKELEFVFVNAPHILAPAEMFAAPPAQLDSQGPAAGGPTAEEMQADEATALRGWWQPSKDGTVARGLEESIMSLREVLRGAVFDGVFGFSQGAGLAAVLAALLERPHLYPPFLVDGAAPHPPFKFCVSVSGFRLRDPLSDTLFAAPYTTPTLHVLGRTDVVVTEERSRQLVALSAAARVEEHDGGHFVPSKGPWRKFLVGWMKDPAAQLVAPGAAAANVDSSGTSTPVPGEA
ncbi:hypothetical protein HYPSUDRAFT_196868 [Hypholoma sublateritium FD-334 SS-4]|uniref:Serine hydrolase domain-containing protein n=1 Tax=Hypholoma sublateritium (strain FD-334 SS-4) TaxID=945553 RepID=A0A0D2MXC9_HYPSF|nr:hypothetical protein HYPSUDRAFT_196868 [Hypholoma sublateritium FD-334 SS-4]